MALTMWATKSQQLSKRTICGNTYAISSLTARILCWISCLKGNARGYFIYIENMFNKISFVIKVSGFFKEFSFKSYKK